MWLFLGLGQRQKVKCRDWAHKEESPLTSVRAASDLVHLTEIYKQHTTPPKHLVTAGVWFLRMVTSLYNWHSGLTLHLFCVALLEWGGGVGGSLHVSTCLCPTLLFSFRSCGYFTSPHLDFIIRGGGGTHGVQNVQYVYVQDFFLVCLSVRTLGWKFARALYVCGVSPAVRLQPHPYPPQRQCNQTSRQEPVIMIAIECAN